MSRINSHISDVALRKSGSHKRTLHCVLYMCLAMSSSSCMGSRVTSSPIVARKDSCVMLYLPNSCVRSKLTSTASRCRRIPPTDVGIHHMAYTPRSNGKMLTQSNLFPR